MKSQTQYMVRKILAVVCASALACTMGAALVGCGGQAANPSKSNSAGTSGTQVAPAQSSSSSAAVAAGDISVTVDLKNAVGSPEAATTAIPFSEEQVVVNVAKGASVLDALKATGRELVVTGSGNDAAVTSIGGLGNGASGTSSHWTYTVNGAAQTASPATVKLANNDTVVWTFVKA